MQKCATKSDSSSHCLVCSDSNRTAQLLQMAACTSLETTSGMILNRSQSKFEGYCSPIGRKWNATCWVTAPGKGNCSDSNRTAQRSDLTWRRTKAWKLCLAWFWIDSNQSFQPNQSQMKCNVWTPRASIFGLKIFKAICLCKQSSVVLLTNQS